jgi:epidermal growth factor receptor kinase substrate 8
MAATQRSRSGGRRSRSQGPDQGILALRAQLPADAEFVDIFQKFKLCFNILVRVAHNCHSHRLCVQAKLKDHIYEPNAPELLHFLFTPLTLILDACHWGLGRHIAPTVVSPLLSYETRELMRHCLTSKEMDVWMTLGEAWHKAPYV